MLPKTKSTKLKTVKKKQRSNNFLIRQRMWLNTILNLFRPNMWTIPPDIGDRIYLGENRYITKDYMSAMLYIEAYSLNTPVALTSKLLENVKHIVPEVLLDFTFKLVPFKYNPYSSTNKNLANSWQEKLEEGTLTFNEAWYLSSYEVLRSGRSVYRVKTFITVRAKNNDLIAQAINVLKSELNEYNIDVLQIKSDLDKYLRYSAPHMYTRGKEYKDIPDDLFTAASITELLPVTPGANDEFGTFMGISTVNESPYFTNFRQNSGAKNIMVIGPSGEGKTFLVLNWLIDMYYDNYCISITDIKGNEFTGFVKAHGGIIISYKSGSTGYVNTFALDSDDIPKGINSDTYFREMLKLSKIQLKIIVSDSSFSNDTLVDALFEDFLRNLYACLGVSPTNAKTWGRSKQLDAYTVYSYFIKYISPEIRNTYAAIIDKVIVNLRTYMSKDGTNSDIFKEALSIKEILKNKMICFDYGLQDGVHSIDPVSLHLKYFYAQVINARFVSNNYKNHLYTVRVMEEGQIVDNFTLSEYAKEFSLKRALNQVNIMLCNSIASFENNVTAKIILDNVNMWCLGRLNSDDREKLAINHNLEKFKDEMLEIINNPDLDHTFLFINKLTRKTTSTMLKTYVPQQVVNSKIFKIVDTVTKEE